MRDGDLRSALKARLSAESASDSEPPLIIDELGLFGEGRVDVVAVDSWMTGYELKSPADSLNRLPRQVAIYSRVIDFAYLVADTSHFRNARPLLPPWWGILLVRGEPGAVTITHRRKARPNPRIDAGSLAQLLWRDEALQVLTKYGLDRGLRSSGRHRLWSELAERITLENLRAEVRGALRARRDWRATPARRGHDATSPHEGTTSRFLARRIQ